MMYLVTATYYDEDGNPPTMVASIVPSGLEGIASALKDYYGEENIDNINIQSLSDNKLIEIPFSMINEVKNLVP